VERQHLAGAEAEVFWPGSSYVNSMFGAGAGIFNKLEPEPEFVTNWSQSRIKNGPAPQHCCNRKEIPLSRPRIKISKTFVRIYARRSEDSTPGALVSE
jgi:hypothetical protein